MIAVENCVQTGAQSPTPAETFIGLSGLPTFQFHVTHSYYSFSTTNNVLKGEKARDELPSALGSGR